jgi:glycosyltransferase involved in cell wall biosynthesis
MHDCPTLTTPRDTEAASIESRSQCKVAYIMSRFPELTQTFVLFEMLAVEQQHVSLELFPLLRGGQQTKHTDGASLWRKLFELSSKKSVEQVMHPEAAALVQRAHYAPFFSLAVLSAQLYFLCRNPAGYFGALGTIVRGAWGSTNFLFGGLAIFPKAVYFARLMSGMGITHIHAHFANHPTTAALIIHRLTGIPYSFTAHGSDLHRDRHLLREKVAEASFVVPISQYNRDVVEEHCGPSCRERLSIIHCGVDTDVFCPADQAGGRNKSATLQILSVGTLHEVKGHKFLIDACHRLKDRGIDFECNVVGDGPDFESLTKQISQLALSDHVHLLGQRTRQQIVGLMHEADVLVAPSVPSQSGRREGIPVVLMEAMACGLPVVASDLSGIPELVDHEASGLLTPPGDADMLVNALARLYIDEELCQQLGYGARAKVLDQFSLSKNASLLARRFSESSEV